VKVFLLSALLVIGVAGSAPANPAHTRVGVTFAAVPEIDPASGASVLALIGAGLLTIRGRKR
jgi:hypothetical protein